MQMEASGQEKEILVDQSSHQVNSVWWSAEFRQDATSDTPPSLLDSSSCCSGNGILALGATLGPYVLLLQSAWDFAKHPGRAFRVTTLFSKPANLRSILTVSCQLPPLEDVILILTALNYS